MESRVIQLTPAADKHGNLNIRTCGLDFFPEGILGGSTGNDLGIQITINAVGLSDPIKTDIPADKRTGRPRWIFRERTWVKRFLRSHNLKPGDKVRITRLDETTYEVRPHNDHNREKEQGHSRAEIEIPTQTHAKNTSSQGLLNIGHTRTCKCPKNHINCLTAKEWLKCQLGVWQFTYEGRDVRDKKVHPATFPVALARRVIELFSHEGELVLDPFVGSGTTLIAAQDTGRNGVGFHLEEIGKPGV